MARRSLIAVLIAALSVAVGVAPASAATKKPRIEKFSYAPIGEVNSEVNPQATFDFTVRLYAHAPSIEFAIDGNSGNIQTAVFPVKSYRPGLHHIVVKGDALPAGTFKVTLLVHLPGGRQLKGSNPATLVVTQAGPGTVTRL